MGGHVVGHRHTRIQTTVQSHLGRRNELMQVTRRVKLKLRGRDGKRQRTEQKESQRHRHRDKERQENKEREKEKGSGDGEMTNRHECKKNTDVYNQRSDPEKGVWKEKTEMEAK